MCSCQIRVKDAVRRPKKKKDLTSLTSADEAFLVSSKGPLSKPRNIFYFDGNQDFLLKRTIVQPFCIILNQVQRQCFLFPDCPEILLQLKYFKMSGADFFM